MAVEQAADTGAADTAKPADDPADTAADDLLGDVAAGDKAAADDKPADKAADDEDDLLEGKVKEGEDQKTDAPDDYEFTVPEGYELDADMAASFKPVAKELGLTQDQAQGLVEKFGPQLLTQIGEKQAAQWNQIKQGWAKEAKADPDVFDAKAGAVRPEVAMARDYVGPEFTAAIKLLGGSNHPAILKGLAKIGKALGEDAPGFGNPAKTKPQPTDFYKNDQPKS